MQNLFCDAGRTMDVLLVEDNPGDARLAAEAFRNSEVPVKLHTVSDGLEAMLFLRREGAYVRAPRPQLILLDLNLPKVDGRETLAQIKTDPRFKAIPTVILTTSQSEEDITYCYENYANCYFLKPTQWDSFTAIVRHVNEVWLGVAMLPGMKG
jgi:two-component system, chemotaxis family, response regulator Rcp1